MPQAGVIGSKTALWLPISQRSGELHSCCSHDLGFEAPDRQSEAEQRTPPFLLSMIATHAKVPLTVFFRSCLRVAGTGCHAVLVPSVVRIGS